MSPTVLLEGVTPLSHWGLIRAQGDDTAVFLQGQLTNDVAGMGLSEARLAGYCSAKGRLLATFVLWKRTHDEFLLACSADVLPQTLKRLSMFVLRARCKLSDAGDQWRLAGLAGAAAEHWLGAEAPQGVWSRGEHAGAQVVRLPDAGGGRRYLAALAKDADLPPLPALDVDAWRWLEVQSAVPWITAATVEQFVPQMVNLELVGGVDFQKGCYPGQEVVARSQYRGTVKRRLALFDTADAAHAGQEVFHAADPQQPAGMVVNAAPRPGGGHSASVEIKLAALAGGSLHLGRPDGALLEPRPLPYGLPADPA